MSDSPVRVERDGPLAVLTVSAPPVNLYDQAMYEGLVAALDELEADLPRALLLRAEGRVWTGGVDVNEFHALSTTQGAELWERLFRILHRFEHLPLPTVFACHALCLTWG